MRENPEWEYPITIHLDATDTVIGMSYGQESKVWELWLKLWEEKNSEWKTQRNYINEKIIQSIHTKIMGTLCFDIWRYSEWMVVQNGIGENKKFCKNPDNIRPWDIVQADLQTHIDHILRKAA